MNHSISRATIRHGLLIAAGLIVSGCCATHTRIGLPDRPLLEPIDAELQAEIAPHTLAIIGSNDLKLKAYAKMLERRIQIHDDAMK